jgi:hypothetical protein
MLYPFCFSLAPTLACLCVDCSNRNYDNTCDWHIQFVSTCVRIEVWPTQQVGLCVCIQRQCFIYTETSCIYKPK